MKLQTKSVRKLIGLIVSAVRVKPVRLVHKYISRPMKKLYMKFKRLHRFARKIARMRVSVAIPIFYHFVRVQLMLRPRIKLFSGVLITLILFYFLSLQALAYIKPREALVKINGQAILVADQSASGQNLDEVEISQNVSYKLSPFGFAKPVEAGTLSQGFSYYHPANDIAAPFGSDIHPVGDGLVEFAGFTSDGKGNIVIVDHGDGLKTLYAHMGKIYVGMGNKVGTETVLGTVGLTGHTTGAHVHFEVHDHDTAVNPANILPSN